MTEHRYKERDVKFRLLARTNNFLFVMSVRYGLLNSNVVMEKIVRDDNNIAVHVPLLVLSDFLRNSNLTKETVESIKILCTNVGYIREHLIGQIQHEKTLHKNISERVPEFLKMINEKYKDYINDILEENIVGDFLTKKEVERKLKEMLDEYEEKYDRRKICKL